MTWHPHILRMLRTYPNNPDTPNHLRPNGLMAEAADRIEALEAELATAYDRAAKVVEHRAESSASNADWSVLNNERQTLIDRFDLKVADDMKLAAQIRALATP